MTDTVTLPRELVNKVLDTLYSTDTPEGTEEYEKELSAIRDIMEALKTTKSTCSPSDCVIPAGWRLVPVEPTDEMLRATVKGYAPEFISHRLGMSWSLYRAMLTAAPQPGSNLSTLENSNDEKSKT